jgi:hypothetical protein
MRYHRIVAAPPSCQPCNPRDSRSRTVLSLSQVSNQTVKKKALSSTKFPHFISYGKRHVVAKMWRDASTVRRPIGRVAAWICSFSVSIGSPAIPTDRHGMLRPRQCATQPFLAATATKRRKGRPEAAAGLVGPESTELPTPL